MIMSIILVAYLHCVVCFSWLSVFRKEQRRFDKRVLLACGIPLRRGNGQTLSCNSKNGHCVYDDVGSLFVRKLVAKRRERHS